ncbi:MAG: DNA helicase RecQ [Bacteroidales bacterium]|nr:DNA helicase RecQ [Bacteroidales bacterium]
MATIRTEDIRMHELLKKYFGFDNFKLKQEEIIKNLLKGRNTFVLMPTGGGKSLCYQLPAIAQEGTAVVISPLIALMKNQVDMMRAFSVDERVAHFLNSSLTKAQINKVKSDVLNGKTKILYLAPESLAKEENIEFLKKVNISFYAIDEAHCISEWGHDFRPEYRRIRPMINEVGLKPIIALTATATPKVQHDILKTLDIMDADVFKTSFNRPNLYYEVRPKIGATKEIIKYIKSNPGKSGIIYCLTRKKVEEMAARLVANGIRALPYHAGLDTATRNRNQDAFLMEEVEVMVATIAFGMGIDKPDIRFIIHYDMPKSLESYYQETGRAGRDGGEGHCIAFYNYDDVIKIEKYIQGKPVSELEIAKHLLLETIAYAESSVCRRKVLLNYFGEDFEEDNCGNCDNCLNPKTEFDGKETTLTLLECIQEVNEKFKAEHIAEILIGNATSTIKSYNHHLLESFGAGSDESKRFWLGIIRQLLIKKLIEKDLENYGVLKLTPEGKKFLKEPYEIKLLKDHEYEEGDDEDFITRQIGDNAADSTLFAMLKDLRKSIAKKLNLPPFVIFQDNSLEEMATHYPITMDELKNIVGVGAGKAQKYGQPFLDLIKKYVEENEIERPQDMVIKSAPPKSSLKIFLIQSIDRKISFEDICNAKQVDFNELLDELEAIVYSGTKLDIKYAVEELIEPEKIEEAYEYFKKAETDSISDALKELGPDYTEEELRLIRLKFISELGN